MRTLFLFFPLVLILMAQVAQAESGATAPPQLMECADKLEGVLKDKRLVCADVAAFEQPIVYNRFGSFNPFGMMFALKRDLTPADRDLSGEVTANYCDSKTGAEHGMYDSSAGGYAGRLSPGNVRLKDCKRPRPMVLRTAVGDVLKIQLTNYLQPDQPGFSETFCKSANAKNDYRRLRENVSETWKKDDPTKLEHEEFACSVESRKDDRMFAEKGDADWPLTRGLSFAIQGLRAINLDGTSNVKDVCKGIGSIGPKDDPVTCYYLAEREGTYFLSSKATPAGGEGNGGAITHGLFGAVVVEPKNSKWYRSQTSKSAFNLFWPNKTAETDGKVVPRHARSKGGPNYEVLANDKGEEVTDGTGVPVLNFIKPRGDNAVELVHTDLNAIVFRPGTMDCPLEHYGDACGFNYREFSVFFHDELKTFFSKEFEELDRFGEGQLAGVRDGFAINYGASGMGTMLLANRKGIGPAADCPECLYEEFFLSSWANGDPALLEQYSDDPSNVHHSYLNDRVVFRNFHAGPKETHVFHLHAHQWFAGNDPNRGAYLDSQTVGPEQGFSYDIYHGGLPRFAPNSEDQEHNKGKGWWQTVGAGNRNRSTGDSIFHCHLYPHFAQGMWELWRNHDVLEDGTRKLPDGQKRPGLSVTLNDNPRDVRAGSVNRKTGAWQAVATNGESSDADGTPVPAIIPLPSQALPLLPSYGDAEAAQKGTPEAQAGMPGYPFYVAGVPGHRPPQAPMDVAENGGLPRHVITGGDRTFEVAGAEKFTEETDPEKRRQLAQQYMAKVLALGNFAAHFEKIDVEFPGDDGSPLEQAAMGFHFNGTSDFRSKNLKLYTADGKDAAFVADEGSYTSIASAAPGAASDGLPAYFGVNGAPPKPGAPFADPCAVASGLKWRGKRPYDANETDDQLLSPKKDQLQPGRGDFVFDPGLRGFRRYKVSAVQLDLVTNRAGWHDPQARINVLTEKTFPESKFPGSAAYKKERRVSATEEPFFFRALSGECIEFQHTNELPKDLELDDFQVKTPTDTIGQHIHLVKFDVMAADGSGNGWNYEDGTFAPDEVVARICAAHGADKDKRDKFCFKKPDPGQVASDKCEPDMDCVPQRKNWWKEPINTANRSEQPFQTTVQRWYADPILSSTGNVDGVSNSKGKAVDRTLRTVFTHDHFGPSSIQQHGFYSALIIEPPCAEVKEGDIRLNPLPPELGDDIPPKLSCEINSKLATETVQPEEDPLQNVAQDASFVGAHKIIAPRTRDAIDENFREYALAIADFATLYDPQDFQTEDQLLADTNPKGLAMLACEAKHRGNADDLRKFCHGAEAPFKPATPKEMGWSPAWLAGGMADDISHSPTTDMFNKEGVDEVAKLGEHLKVVRMLAAGCSSPDDPAKNTYCDKPRFAKPVAPPRRPESISVDHHDPYLVNYRGDPIPLRIGKNDSTKSDAEDCLIDNIENWVEGGGTGERLRDPDKFGECSTKAQKSGLGGDLANVFLNKYHGNPVTPLIEAYDGERIALRMIQGAQEVQHVFNLDAYTFNRNVDQRFPAGSRRLETTLATDETDHAQCIEDSRVGLPLEYRQWFEKKSPIHDSTFWQQQEARIANCENADGRTTAQEIGISEHFEIDAKIRNNYGFEKFEAASAATGGGKTPALPVITDYLYHYGGSDDLWNGAWGLARIYRSPDEDDVSTCTRDPMAEDAYRCLKKSEEEPVPKISARLERFSSGGESVKSVPENLQQLAMQCPTHLENGEKVQTVRAAAVALTNRQVWGRDQSYGGSLTDPDGLFLAVFGRSDFDTDQEFDQFWSRLETGATPLSELIVRIDNGPGSGPQPFTLDVEAGDCLKLAVINGLAQDDSKDGAAFAFAKLRDRLGDALMPPITPLNTDPSHSGGDGVEIKYDTVNGTRDVENVWPSASLALRLQLPLLNKPESVALPYGVNATPAIPPSTGQIDFRTSESPSGNAEMLTFFAGRARLPQLSRRPSTEVKAVVDVVMARISPASVSLDGGVDAKLEFDICDESQGGNLRLADIDVKCELSLNVAGVRTGPFSLESLASPITDLNPAVQQLKGNAAARKTIEDSIKMAWNEAVTLALSGNEVVHWVPYAFGPLPLKSVADVIGHPTQGLFGVVNVIPRNRKLDTSSIQPPATGNAVPSTLHLVGDRKIRSFTIAIQDGLGLRDENSKLHPTDKTGKDYLADNKLSSKTEGIHPVPDCKVCDDSYDLGEQAVSYISASVPQVLRRHGIKCWKEPKTKSESPSQVQAEANTDFNTCPFPEDFYRNVQKGGSQVLNACVGEEIVIRVVHPGGRQRQHTFTTIGVDYDDLFPSFGFPHAALLGPGKVVTAHLTRRAEEGQYLWTDGTSTLRSGGVWGLLQVHKCGE